MPTEFSAGEITGRVQDPDGEALPGVKVTARSPDAERGTDTDIDGRYRFLGLPPGDYEVTFEMPGLATNIKKASVKNGSEVVLNVTLEVATT